MLTGQNHLKDKMRQEPNISNDTEGESTPVSHSEKLFKLRCYSLFLTDLDCFCLRSSAHHEVQDGGDVYGDRLLCVLPVWLDPGVLHSSHRVLDVLRGGKHCADHLQLLLQPVEGLHLRHHRGVGLQGLPFHAGSAW